MNDHPLSNFEQILGDLVLELLRADKAYPGLILSEPSDARGEVFSPNSVRVTQHYITALLAYGFSTEDEELQRAAHWFAAPFPNTQGNRIDNAEMNRLDALLQLAPHDPYLGPRLAQLVRQRSIDNQAFVIDKGGDFETLWAIKVLALAGNWDVLPHDDIEPEYAITRKTLISLLNRVNWDGLRDKDLALTVRLRVDLARKLTKKQHDSLNRLLAIAETAGGLWGLKDRDMLWLTDRMRQEPLAPGDVANHREAFRDMIVDTCYVIENLAVLAATYPEVQEPLQEAMELWWSMFRGGGAVATLRGLFPEPYDFLIVLCRTVVAVCAYIGGPPIRRISTHIHRQYAQEQYDFIELPERANIRQALHNWIKVDIEGELERLRLGMSDSDVMRVRPFIRHPLYPDSEEARLHFTNARSLIVKFGRLHEISNERRNYARLPASILDCFVRMPNPSFVDETGRAFVVMEDLTGHWTLEEIFQRWRREAHEALCEELGPFLLRIHRGDGRPPALADNDLMQALYLLPMQSHIGRIFNYIHINRLLDDSRASQEDTLGLQQALVEMCSTLVARQFQLNGFPVAYMHGDLHSRNIMIRLLKSGQRVGIRGALEFKLIDLEKLTSEGDAALDAGELLVDLALLRGRFKTERDREAVMALTESLQAVYADFADSRQDDTFAMRLELAQARALLRIAKGKTKQGEMVLRESSRRAPAINLAKEILGHAQQAAEHLANVLIALNQEPTPSPARNLIPDAAAIIKKRNNHQ